MLTWAAPDGVSKFEKTTRRPASFLFNADLGHSRNEHLPSELLTMLIFEKCFELRPFNFVEGMCGANRSVERILCNVFNVGISYFN